MVVAIQVEAIQDVGVLVTMAVGMTDEMLVVDEEAGAEEARMNDELVAEDARTLQVAGETNLAVVVYLVSAVLGTTWKKKITFKPLLDLIAVAEEGAAVDSMMEVDLMRVEEVKPVMVQAALRVLDEVGASATETLAVEAELVEEGLQILNVHEERTKEEIGMKAKIKEDGKKEVMMNHTVEVMQAMKMVTVPGITEAMTMATEDTMMDMELAMVEDMEDTTIVLGMVAGVVVEVDDSEEAVAMVALVAVVVDSAVVEMVLKSPLKLPAQTGSLKVPLKELLNPKMVPMEQMELRMALLVTRLQWLQLHLVVEGTLGADTVHEDTVEGLLPVVVEVDTERKFTQ
jgi:hypothetical protein